MKLHALVGTQSEFDHSEKGDALYAFELALCAARLLGRARPRGCPGLGCHAGADLQAEGWGGARRFFQLVEGAGAALEEVRGRVCAGRWRSSSAPAVEKAPLKLNMRNGL